MDEQHESIKNKLKKLLALAERGMQGEAENIIFTAMRSSPIMTES